MRVIPVITVLVIVARASCATTTVQIEKTGRGMLILDPKAEAKRLKALAMLYGCCPEFPQIEPLPTLEP